MFFSPSVKDSEIEDFENSSYIETKTKWLQS